MWKQFVWTFSLIPIYCSQAAMVSPVFSGEWHVYGDGVARNYDSCGIPVYYYSNLVSGNAEEAAKALINEPTLESCTWGPVILKNYSPDEVPADYPNFSQTQYTWAQIIANTANPDSDRFENVSSIQRAVFRCDTLIDYAYQAGAEINIPTNGFYLPLSTYNSFSQSRFPGVPLFSSQKVSSSVVETVPFKANTLEDILASSVMNPESLDKVATALVSDPSIPRQEKLNHIWNLALIYQNSPTLRFNYLIDMLNVLHPFELEPQFMELYQSTTNVSNKLELISAIWQGMIPDKKTRPFTEDDKNTFERVDDFLETQIKTTQDPYLLAQLLEAYSALVPGVVADELIDEKLSELKGKTFVDFHNQKVYLAMPEKEAFTIKIRRALMTSEAQTRLFPELLEQHKNNPVFANTLCWALVSYPMNQLLNSTRQSSYAFLQSWKQPILSSGIKSQNLDPCQIKWALKVLTAGKNLTFKQLFETTN